MPSEPLPDLQLVPLERCVLHESVDPRRVARLRVRIQSDASLRNPPIVTPYPAGDRWMVLDGATRTTAMRELGFQALPVQVVNYSAARIELHTWAHILHDVSATMIVHALRQIDGVRMYAIDHATALCDLRARALLCAALAENGTAWALHADGSLLDHARLLDTIFRTYAGRATIQRLPDDQSLTPARLPSNTAMMAFARYTKADLLELTAAGGILPAGITRHIIPGRVLRLHVPLKELRHGTFAEQSAWFNAWIAARIAGQHARFYHEPTWLFDE
jgi:hypothetical protein